MTVIPARSVARTLHSVRRADPASKAGGVVLAHIAAQVDSVRQQEVLVRAFDADAVHNTRAATRRLRGALSTFRPLFDREVIEPIRLQLAWLGGFLGSTRDTGLQRVHLLEAVAAEPDGLVMGPVAEHIDGDLQREFHTAGLELSEALDSPWREHRPKPTVRTVNSNCTKCERRRSA
jgi:inorganic triphosphatase YgiF